MLLSVRSSQVSSDSAKAGRLEGDRPVRVSALFPSAGRSRAIWDMGEPATAGLIRILGSSTVAFISSSEDGLITVAVAVAGCSASGQPVCCSDGPDRSEASAPASEDTREASEVEAPSSPCALSLSSLARPDA